MQFLLVDSRITTRVTIPLNSLDMPCLDDEKEKKSKDVKEQFFLSHGSVYVERDSS